MRSRAFTSLGGKRDGAGPFSAAIGAALESFGKGGGTIAQACGHLLLYAAQCACMVGLTRERFLADAGAAFDRAQREGHGQAKH